MGSVGMSVRQRLGRSPGEPASTTTCCCTLCESTRRCVSGTSLEPLGDIVSGYYPIMLKVQGKRCVVVGGGPVAERKVQTLLECDASVCVISPNVTRGLRDLAAKKRVEIISRDFASGDLEGALLAVAATGDASVNRRVSEEAHARGIQVNVVDDPDSSSFIVPSVVRRGDLMFA